MRTVSRGLGRARGTRDKIRHAAGRYVPITDNDTLDVLHSPPQSKLCARATSQRRINKAHVGQNHKRVAVRPLVENECEIRLVRKTSTYRYVSQRAPTSTEHSSARKRAHSTATVLRLHFLALTRPLPLSHASLFSFLRRANRPFPSGSLSPPRIRIETSIQNESAHLSAKRARALFSSRLRRFSARIFVRAPPRTPTLASPSPRPPNPPRAPRPRRRCPPAGIPRRSRHHAHRNVAFFFARILLPISPLRVSLFPMRNERTMHERASARARPPPAPPWPPSLPRDGLPTKKKVAELLSRENGLAESRPDHVLSSLHWRESAASRAPRARERGRESAWREERGEERRGENARG